MHCGGRRGDAVDTVVDHDIRYWWCDGAVVERICE